MRSARKNTHFLIKFLVVVVFAYHLPLTTYRCLYAAPDAVTDLTAVESGFRHVTLSWTTPYDTVNSTTPAYYEIRLCTYTSISDIASWNSNSGDTGYPYRVFFATGNLTAGYKESRAVTGLTNGKYYFYAIRSSTDNQNWSNIDSTSPRLSRTPQNANPAVVGGYNYTGGVVVTTNTPKLTWSQPGAPGSDGAYGDYIASYRAETSKQQNFATIAASTDGVTAAEWTTTVLEENTTYYWRVKGRDSEGLESMSQQVEQFFVNAVNEAPAQFSLTAPLNSVIVATACPVFQWAASSDPDPGETLTYTVFYSTSISFEMSCTTAASVTALSFHPTDNLSENATYYWKALVTDSTDLQAWSASTGTFRINDPAANEPPNPFSLDYPSAGTMIFISTPTLAWQQTFDPDPGNTVSYNLFYSALEETGGNFAQVYGLTTTTYITPALDEDATYYWKVEATDGVNNTATPVWTFRVNAVNNPPNAFSLLSSSGVASQAQPSLAWENNGDPEDDMTFTLQYSTAADFGVFTSSTGLLTPAFTFPLALQENTTYYWRVVAVDQYGKTTISSQQWPLAINAVQSPPNPFGLLVPGNGASASYLMPQLGWQDAVDPDPFDCVASYTLFYSTYSDFSIQTTVTGLTTWYAFPSTLQNNTTYYWKVDALSAVSGQTTSASWMFYAVNLPPDNFNLLGPSGELATPSPLLDWQDTVDAESDTFTYTLRYSTDPAFGVSTVVTGLAASQYPLVSLPDNSSYSWYVEAVDAWGNAKRSNQTGSFAINQTPEHPAAFTLTVPADRSEVNTVRPLFSWQASYEPDPGHVLSYDLWYSQDPAFAYATVISSIASASYTLASSLSMNSTYYWRVSARGTDGLRTESESRQFYVTGGTKPAAPGDFAVVVSTDKRRAALSWTGVASNEDGSPLTIPLTGYRIYRAYSFDDIFTTPAFAMVGPEARSWSDDSIYNQTIYYAVCALNSWDVESPLSAVLNAGGTNDTIIYPEDRSMTVSVPTEILPSTVTIEVTRLSQQEGNTILASYVVRARGADSVLLDYTFSQPVSLRFKLPGSAQAPGKNAPSAQALITGIFWFNNVEWVYLGGVEDGQALVIRSAYLGSYQLRSVARASEFKTLMTYPKIITPNGDGINDEFNYIFDNPAFEKIETAVYDINGSQVSKMTARTDTWLIWPGTYDGEGRVPPGVYLYQVRCGSKVYNGTVVVAR